MSPTKTRLPALPAQLAIVALSLFLAPATPYAQPAPAPAPAPALAPALSDLSNAYVLPGVYVSHNLREGYRKFDDAPGYVRVEKTAPFIFGLSVGKRVSIDNPRLRLQALLEFGWGSVKDDEYEETLVDESGYDWLERVSEHSIYWTGGLLADAHLLFPQNDRTYFVSAGLGAHLTFFDTALKVSATGEDIKGGSDGLRGALSPSVNLGCGIEYRLGGGGAACISYGMRFWQPTNYKEVGAMFPMGVSYTEFFFSQSIQLQYLLPRGSGD